MNGTSSSLATRPAQVNAEKRSNAFDRPARPYQCCQTRADLARAQRRGRTVHLRYATVLREQHKGPPAAPSGKSGRLYAAETSLARALYLPLAWRRVGRQATISPITGHLPGDSNRPTAAGTRRAPIC